MKKQIIYLTEYLAKSPHEHAFYAVVVQTLGSLELYAPSKFSQPQIVALMKHQGFQAPSSLEEGVKMLDQAFDQALPNDLQEAKKSLFMTLLQANFPKKKGFLSVSLDLFLSQLEPVEKSIYENLLAYVASMNRALSLFFILAQEDVLRFSPEQLVRFAETLHVNLFELLFNEEEQALLHQGLKELLGVYLRLYGKYLYM